MGLDTRKPPLPAPTEPSVLSSIDNDTTLGDDLATDVSRRTDKTSYSVPEDGSPVTITTAKRDSLLRGSHPSQTSLLIEYFEGGKSDGKVRSRPSVRVRVTPSSHRKNNTANDHIQITQTNKNTRKPSYTRRISLSSKREETVSQPTEFSYSEDSHVSGRPPVEVEVLQDYSDLSRSDLSQGRFIPTASDISSMPPDSMLEGEPILQTLQRRRSRSLEREETTNTKDTLKAPSRRRSRSLSKERITQRVMEKLASKPIETGDRSTPTKRRERRVSREELSEAGKSPRRKSSRGHRDEEPVSGTDSSLVSSNVHRRSGDAHSVKSGISATSSINNPKLLQTVEDAIKRLILPELEALKEEQRTQQNRSKFERISRDSAFESVPSASSRDTSRRRVSKSSSAPNVSVPKPKVVLNRDGNDPGIVLSSNSSRKDRRSSRGSEHSYDRPGSRELTVREGERVRHKKSKDRHHSRDVAGAGLAGAVLTAAALRHHNSQEYSGEKRERRRHSRGSRSRSASVAESIEEKYQEESVPPMPLMKSELQGSELTRESILSAETERPLSRSSRGTETAVREVSRGSPRQVTSPTPRTPTRTPVALQRGLYTFHSNRSQGDISLPREKSDQSISSKGRVAAITASLGGAASTAALAKERAIEGREEHVSQYEYVEQTPTRELSPVQSIASFREEDNVVQRNVRSVHSAASLSSSRLRNQRKESSLSIESFESPTSTKVARARERPQGINLEKGRETLGEDIMHDSPRADTPGDAEEFFAENHEQNEMYRRDLENDSQRGSPTVNYKHLTSYTDDSAEGQYLDRVSLGQDIRGIGANPEYVHTPLAVESAVASLHEPSAVSVRSSQSSPLKRGASPVSSLHQDSLVERQHLSSEGDTLTGYQDTPSKERWGPLNDQAQTLSDRSQQERTAVNSPHQSISRSIDEPVKLGASAFPIADDLMPEMGYGLDSESEVTTNPSIIQGPLGGQEYHDRNWHAEPTPPMSAADMLIGQEDRLQTSSHGEKAAAISVGVGAAAIAAAAAARIQQEKEEAAEQHDRDYQPSMEDDYDLGLDQSYSNQPNVYAPKELSPASPALWKDEGYQSANQPGGITPEYQSRSKLFDDDGVGDYDDDLGLDDPFMSKGKHARHFSGNSHGMASPLYDSATGKGIDRIQSKDVIALMDHLTVRDAQRNARDTEILVTLVRSAAEMRTSFEEMKKFVAEQDRLIMASTDKRVDMVEQRLLQGPRPQPLGSPRQPRQRSTEDMGDVQSRKKNVFRRALKGLSMRSSNDLAKIEEMLMQLLGEVEGLKESQSMQRQQTRSNSLNSYENLRAGYEPEGHAGTSSPNHSGYLSNPSSRKVDGMHSGYDGRRRSEHRISTVLEGDEELEEHEAHVLDNQFENNERLLTPTQEVRRNNSLPQETPPSASQPFQGTQSQENTPKRKHKSNSSSIFGFPKNLSRWSKTTASTVPDSAGRTSGSRDKRPYSDASRSGSNLNVNYYDESHQYEVHEDDRLRSTTSLHGSQRGATQARPPSPLIPEQGHQQGHQQSRDFEPELDDPKYQAHRNSLNLMHPQPRPGPTHRHQSHLESQAQVFEPVASPDFDQWGSNPSLARNRLSGGGASAGAGNLSPISSDGGYSQHSAAEQAAPPRPAKNRDDGPLVPQQPLAGQGQTRQMYSSPGGLGSQGQLTPLAPIQEVRYSLETDTGHHYSPTPSPRPNQNLSAKNAVNSPQRKITGPRPMGSRSPSGQPVSQQQQHGSFDNTGTVRRKPIARNLESLESYRSSLESETF
ncbi:uncharacterized protein K441DRAFT_597464 [Cenococcum geophilum 1.58]|uniref:Uncharacterized protein n=1 Tax=Cenococcum geophilum 1.58 TaxID=794803 RepID=A0ACC8EKN4_9PEZI|nr:hypothetical protein K441DRAFT_597464 [Cenococcum geophilum 1.58]